MKNGAKVDQLGSQNCTPLILSVICNHLDLAHKLLELGANVNHCSDLGTPLTDAIRSSNLEMIRLLLRYKANLQLPDGQSAVVYAAEMKQNEVVELLEKEYGCKR